MSFPPPTSLTISTTIVYLLLFLSSADLLAQFPHSSIKDELTNPPDITGAVYTALTSEFISSKNLSQTPYRITEEHYVEDGFLQNVGNVTNNQTYENAYLSDGLTVGKGKGTIETAVGQKINWISSDLGTFIDNQWLFYGIILFNNTYYEPLSLLNNTIGVYIVWFSDKNMPNNNSEVFFRASTNGGATFGDKINLSNTTSADSVDAEIAADGDEVIVTWWERNQTSNEPIFRASVDNGLTFGSLLRLGTNGTIGANG